MRVFICFEGSSEPFDILPHQTVQAMKQMVKEAFLVQLFNNKQVQQYLELSYGGAVLQDSWALCDVGITSGSAIQCLIKTEQRPVMSVFNAVTGDTIPVMESEALLNMSVATLKTVVSMQSHLPVSTFRLSTLSGVQLYDCNQLQDYAIEVGSTLRLDTWDGWVEFLQGCLRGHRLTVQTHLSEKKPVMRFQLQVALYIAASLGHLDLAGWLLERGMRAEEPVGVHPHRQWCHQTAHQDTRKCPIHIAAASSQLLILKLFTANNVLTLACQDPGGRDPLKVAIQCGHRDCVRYLANKMCAVVSLPNITLPMHVYLQLKRWVGLGQKRAASNQCKYTSAAFKAAVGDALLVDGFNQPKMSSKSSKAATKPRGRIKAKVSRPLPPIGKSFSASHLPSKKALPQPPILQSVNPSDAKEVQKKQKQAVKIRDSGQVEEINEGNNRSCRGKFILPPITTKTNPGPICVGASPESLRILTVSLESCGRTPRENATYCLTVASTFTEKPWSKQLNIARTLIKRRAHTTA